MSANTKSQLIFLMTARNKFNIQHPMRKFYQQLIDEIFQE